MMITSHQLPKVAHDLARMMSDPIGFTLGIDSKEVKMHALCDVWSVIFIFMWKREIEYARTYDWRGQNLWRDKNFSISKILPVNIFPFRWLDYVRWPITLKVTTLSNKGPTLSLETHTHNTLFVFISPSPSHRLTMYEWIHFERIDLCVP